MTSLLPKVEDYMDNHVPTVPPDMPVLDAVDFLLGHHVTGAPVVDGSGALLGIFTERDCLKLVAHSADPEHTTALVSEFMSKDVATIPPEMDIYYAAGNFLKHHFRRFPVVDANGKLVGAITRFDLLRAIRANRGYFESRAKR